ncbi:transglycosylase SLT domain-containing protein [Ideonella sp. A 288]|uniref:transglycosylase SLT domain-containing protein n=1 Tax=Ideonella sp. A 288 TaxID=1962181 RepID=UPI001F185D81|nr:transglycosylase SLT domain-containing protein [Ideonella sp. A 288]
MVLGSLCGLATAQSALAPLAAVTPQLVAPALAIEVLRLRADATAHEHGEGVARDGARAAALYCQAARLGDTASLYSLGWMHAHGRGVPRDDAQAAWFFAAAAALGDGPSRRMLATLGPAAAEVPDCLRPPEPPPAPPVAVVDDDPPPVFHAVARSVPPQAPKSIVDLVKKLAPQYRLEPHLVLAIMAAESNFDPTVVSPKNAQGLMQLIPDTAARFNVQDPFDPTQSIKGGMAYLRWLMAYFEGDVTLVAAAYNAGEGTVERYKGVPPFAETQAYIERIRRFIGDLVLPFDARVTRPSPHLRQGRGNG